jgi:hypothetical protein
MVEIKKHALEKAINESIAELKSGKGFFMRLFYAYTK